MVRGWDNITRNVLLLQEKMFDDLHRSGNSSSLQYCSVNEITIVCRSYTFNINRTILTRVSDFIIHSDRFSESLFNDCTCSDPLQFPFVFLSFVFCFLYIFCFFNLTKILPWRYHFICLVGIVFFLFCACLFYFLCTLFQKEKEKHNKYEYGCQLVVR